VAKFGGNRPRDLRDYALKKKKKETATAKHNISDTPIGGRRNKMPKIEKLLRVVVLSVTA